MSGKLTLDEINKMANEPDSDEQIREDRAEAEDGYEDEFQNQPVEEIDQEYQPDEEYADDLEREEEVKSNHTPINDMSQVRSQVQEEGMIQEMGEDVSIEESASKFKKDEDLSLAKSEFIQSSNLDNLKINSKLKDKSSKQILNQAKGKGKEKEKPKTASGKAQNRKPARQKVTKQVQKPKVQKEEDKKPKLSESEIKEKMRVVQEEKERFLKKKQEKQQKDEELRRKEYEEAKKLEEERKNKNKKVLEEQKKKKKEGGQVAKSQMKIQEAEVKLPEKRTDFTYTNMVKDRKMMEKNIQKQIEQDNKNKLKKLLEKPQSQLKGEARKAAFLQQRKVMRERENKMRQVEVNEGDVLVVKQIKREIIEAKKFNKQKNEQINRAQKTIQDLQRKLKQKQKKFFQKYNNDGTHDEHARYSNVSELSPIQKMVICFPQARNSDEIFKLIDANGDGVLSSQEIKQKLIQFNLDQEVIKKVEDILDENSDGTVSHQEFVFLIDQELKKQKDYREIMGTLQLNDPIDLEAKIVDMQAKIKFINEKTEQHDHSKNTEDYAVRLGNLQRKAQKLQSKWRKQNENRMEGEQTVTVGLSNAAHLANIAMKLKNQKNIKKSFLEQLRVKVKQNLSDKNGLLASRVEQNLRLQQEIFRLKNDIQERELRFLSLKKIQENKRGYLQRQSEKMKEMEQAYKKTKQYKISIADPSKKNQIAAERDEMRLLAAVLMIQRNYRKRKARGQFQKLKAEKTSN